LSIGLARRYPQAQKEAPAERARAFGRGARPISSHPSWQSLSGGPL